MRDVTNQIEATDYLENQIMFIRKCFCGYEYDDFIVGDSFILENKNISECEKCGRKFYCEFSYKIFEVTE